MDTEATENYIARLEHKQEITQDYVNKAIKIINENLLLIDGFDTDELTSIEDIAKHYAVESGLLTSALRIALTQLKQV